MEQLSNIAVISSIILSIICFIYWFFTKIIFTFWSTRNVPYLKPSVPFGNTLDIYLGKITIGELFSRSYLELKAKGAKLHGGIFCLYNPVYIPIDPDLIKSIMITNFEKFPNHGLFVDPENDPLSNHLFNMEGSRWRDLRSKLPIAFTGVKMRKMFEMMVDLSETFNGVLEEYSSRPVNIKDLLNRFTIDVICYCGLGIESNTMKKQNEYLLKAGSSFISDHFGLLYVSLVLAIPRPILQALRFKTFRKETENFGRRFFKDILEYRKKDNVSKDDILGTVGKLSEERIRERSFDGKTMIDPLTVTEYSTQMFGIYAASFETSSGTLTFALYELAKHPAIQSRLRREIHDVLRKHDEKVTYEALMEMKYLESVVDETLRLYPVLPILPRLCTEDFKVPGTDLTIQKNSLVVISNMGIHRDPDYYPDPLKFDPDRFSPENKHSRPATAYLPFGDGPRVCIGKRFALQQIKIGLSAILKKYEVTLDEKTAEDMKFRSSLLLSKRGDVWLNLKKIKD